MVWPGADCYYWSVAIKTFDTLASESFIRTNGPFIREKYMATSKRAAIAVEQIERSIILIRGQKVMLDADLAVLYGVTTKRLNEQVKRNYNRFPDDFAYQLTTQEVATLRSHSATSKGRGGRRTLPYAFTEHGAVMVASVLNSPIAIETSIQVVRAFVRLREMLASHKELSRRLDELEQKYDKQFAVVFDAIRQLMTPPTKEQRQMGYHTLMEKR